MYGITGSHHVKLNVPSAGHHLHHHPVIGGKMEILLSGCSKLKLWIPVFKLAREAEVRMVKDHTWRH
jgi:hypothetical protein